MEIRSLAVVGAGQMGAGIAHVAAAAGLRVVLADVAEDLLLRARTTIEKNLDREVAKGRRTTEEKVAALGRMTHTVDLSAVASAELVVEAIVENESAKKDLFRVLDPLCPPSTRRADRSGSSGCTS
jgi:3-hydroxybutyryl-CoA dehydrogenase